MHYQLPPWLSLAAPPAIAMALVAALLVVGKVPFRYNVRNLLVRWKTTLLTALAFTVVVALLMVMHAFATGIQRVSQGSGQPAAAKAETRPSSTIHPPIPVDTTIPI